jgi:magnesium chelatase family protein
LKTLPAHPHLAPDTRYDFHDVKGQLYAKRALEVAAAGGHSVLMSGPPGTGKSMLASRFVSILPAMTEQEALESAAIQSLNGQFKPQCWGLRPYRAPHHTASAVALVGGGGTPRPGEISLAHHGVLFLDELPEFDRKVLEVLREPLESGHITISRAARQADFPARFQLIAAMNPCPCGYLSHYNNRCRCPETRRLDGGG